jgi:hypothetical protein
MKYYKISEKALRELITAANQFYALECGGVDNWMWCGESCCDFLRQCGEDASREFEDFEELTDYEITGYPVIEITEGE